MFRDDGRWKEFGIGRDPEYFTYCPFWLFTIVWAIISYVSIVFMEDAMYDSATVAPVRTNRVNRVENVAQQSNTSVQELVPGYYMLNEGASGRNGVPRYVYLGPEEP